MRVRLFEDIDITARVLNIPRESATWNNIDGLIAPVRDVDVLNSDGLYSPNSTNSIFSDDSYRNKFIEIFNDDDNLIYKGLIEDVTQKISEEGQNVVTIHSRDALGSFLNWPVAAGANINGISTNASRTAGQNTLQIPDTVPISAGAVVSTSAAKIPSYEVKSVVTGGGNQLLTLDRGLEQDIASSTPLFFSLPEITTIPKALMDAFYTPLAYYGLTSLLGSSFDALHVQDLANGRTIRNFVRREEGVEMSKHIGKLLEMGSYNLTRSDNGVFEIVDRLAYDGEALLESIEDADIFGAVESIDDKSRLNYAFSMLYLDGAVAKLLEYDLQYGYGVGEVPQFEPGLTADLIEKAGATKPYKPVVWSSSSLSGYNYLYGSLESARYYGLKRLNYSAYKRKSYKINIKPFKSGNPDAPINLSYFKKMLLNLTIDENESYTNEPVIVLAYEKDPETGAYNNVVIELTNKPTPGLPVP